MQEEAIDNSVAVRRAGTGKPKISAVILTLNEERNIANALRSVRHWVDDIVLVDMYSDDKTVEIARSFGARVFEHPRMGLQDPARPFAMEKATGDWIIHIDADEIVPYELSRHLLEIAEKNLADVCAIPSYNYFSGAPMNYSGWGANSDRHLRFFRNGSVVFGPEIHGWPALVNNARLLPLNFESGHYLLHLNFLDINHFLQKFSRYTTIEAEQAHAKGVRSSFTGFLWPPLKEFFTRYIRKQGFRDGWRGLYFCSMLGAYKMTVAAKLREIEIGCSGSNTGKYYQNIAEEYLSRYQQESK